MANDKAFNGEEKLSQGREGIENFAAKARDEGEKIMNEASNKVSCLTNQLSDSVHDAKSMVGDKITSLAGTIRENAPHDGKLGSAATAVANTLESSGSYLEKDFGQMADDMSSIVKKYPIPSMLAGLGLGFFVGSLITSSRK